MTLRYNVPLTLPSGLGFQLSAQLHEITFARSLSRKSYHNNNNSSASTSTSGNNKDSSNKNSEDTLKDFDKLNLKQEVSVDMTIQQNMTVVNNEIISNTGTKISRKKTQKASTAMTSTSSTTNNNNNINKNNILDITEETVITIQETSFLNNNLTISHFRYTGEQSEAIESLNEISSSLIQPLNKLRYTYSKLYREI